MRSLSRSLVAMTFSTMVFCAGVRAKADTISVFSLNSNLLYGTASGTLVVDTTTGVLNSGSVTASLNGQTETLGTVMSSSGSNGLYTIELTTGSGGTGDRFYLDLPVSTLMSYTGGSIDALTYNAAHASYLESFNTMDYATSGTLNLTGTSRTATGTAVTPEAASWVLMLTGTGMLAVVARRRRPLAESPAVSA